MRFLIIILFFISLSFSQICPFEVFHESAYAVVPITSILITENIMRKFGIERRNRVIINIIESSLYFIALKIYDDKIGREHTLRYSSLGAGVVGGIGLAFIF